MTAPGAAPAEPLVITEPGVYSLPVETYHADPVQGGSLSRSGAVKLLPPYCPALFAYEREHGQPSKDEFDFGNAAHRIVLGTGPDIRRVEADDWRTRKAQTERVEARASGQVPMLAADHDQVLAMAAKLAAHPIAGHLFNPASGVAEQTLVWNDREIGVWRRALLDWLPGPSGRRLIVPDYKTSRSAEPEKWAKSAVDYGYHQQAAWYLDGVRALGLDDDPAFVFVVQEKSPPYLVTLIELDVTALKIGRHLNRRALDLYAECTASGRWPGYSDDVVLQPLPYWYENRLTEEMAA